MRFGISVVVLSILAGGMVVTAEAAAPAATLTAVEHPMLGTKLHVPSGWKVELTRNGYRLTRGDSTINVSLIGKLAVKPETYFATLAKVSNVKRIDIDVLRIGEAVPPQAAFELTHEGKPSSRSQVVLRESPQGTYVLGLDCPAADFARQRQTFAAIAASLSVPDVPPATAPPSSLSTGESALPAAETQPTEQPERFTHEAMAFSCVEPDGWTRQVREDGESIRWITPDQASLIQVSIDTRDAPADPKAFAKTWEATAIDGDANKEGFKRAARNETTVNGWPVYIGVYSGDSIGVKNIFLAGPKNRVYILSGIFSKNLMADRVAIYDAFVSQFQPLGGEPPAAKSHGPGPLVAADGSFRLVVPQHMTAQRQANAVSMSGREDSPLQFMHILVQSQGVVGDADALAEGIKQYQAEVRRVRPKAEIDKPTDITAPKATLSGRQFVAQYVADDLPITQRVALLRSPDGRFFTVIAMAPRQTYQQHVEVVESVIRSLEIPPAEKR